MDRATLLAYLIATFSTLFAETKTGESDDPNGIGYELDQVFRVVTEGDSTVAEATEALGEYYLLRRFRKVLSTRGDIQTHNMHPARSQIFKNVTDLLKEAAERCAALGYPVEATQGYDLGYLQTDWTEPDPTP